MDIKDRLYKVKESIVERYNKLDKQSYKTFFKKNLKWLVAVVIIIFLALGYYIGNITTTKSQVLKELNIALKEGNARKLTKIIEVNNESVDKEEIEPLAEYFKGKDEVVNNTINKINRDNKTEIFELISKKGLFKDKYYINLKTFNIT
ncbi:YfgM family protein, partial [Clostridium baratii]